MEAMDGPVAGAPPRLWGGGVRPKEQSDRGCRRWPGGGGASSVAGGGVRPEEHSDRGGRGWPSGGGAASVAGGDVRRRNRRTAEAVDGPAAGAPPRLRSAV
jgi:hypothetical protein